jgi:hypothetical protein
MLPYFAAAGHNMYAKSAYIRAGYRGEEFDTIRIAIQGTICDIY